LLTTITSCANRFAQCALQAPDHVTQQTADPSPKPAQDDKL
jgi:hypothetical protein